MGGIISAIFGLTKPSSAQPQGPSAEEIAAQKRLDEIEDKRAAAEEAKSKARTRVTAKAAAGPQTLFTRPGTIPRAIKFGGGS